jgi:hypothetical protein
VAERAVAPYRDAGEQRSLAPAQKSAATERRVENVPDPAQKPIRGALPSNSDICSMQAVAFVPPATQGSCCLSCNGGTEGTPWYYVTGQHLFRSDARPLIRPALASGDGVLSLKSWRAPACINRPASRQARLFDPNTDRVTCTNAKLHSRRSV